jgi:hypothetical protein
MIANSELRDDLDEVRQMHKHEQTSHIIIHMPSLSTSFFWSTSEQNGGGRGFKNEKMCFAPDNSTILPYVIYNRKFPMKKLKSRNFFIVENFSSIYDLDILE